MAEVLFGCGIPASDQHSVYFRVTAPCYRMSISKKHCWYTVWLYSRYSKRTMFLWSKTSLVLSSLGFLTMPSHAFVRHGPLRILAIPKTQNRFKCLYFIRLFLLLGTCHDHPEENTEERSQQPFLTVYSTRLGKENSVKKTGFSG